MAIQVIVVGAGPAGIFSGIFAAREGAEVVIIEKNSTIGKKLAVTGGGRCNFTNSADEAGHRRATVHNSKFMIPALNHLGPEMIMEFFRKRGLEMIIEEDGSVFPRTNRSQDVINVLKEELKKLKVRVELGQEAVELITEGTRVEGVRLRNGESLKADRVVLTTGGASYPKTGSDGTCFGMIGKTGHSIVPLKPALSSIEIQEQWIKGFPGISFGDVLVKIGKGKKALQERGSLLITHYGVSGPPIIKLSSWINERDFSVEEVKLKIDFFPDFSREEIQEWLMDLEKSGRQLKSLLKDHFPIRFLEGFLEVLGIDGQQPMNHLRKKDRNRLIEGFKECSLRIKGLRPIEESMVTAGGVDVKEVNPGTMESRRMRNLYFAGEVLDVDAITGGYNLQIAFSTGALAGTSAGRRGDVND